MPTKRNVRIVLIALISMMSFTLNANNDINPQFSDYQTSVYSGPFATNITLSKEQEVFSERWKKSIRKELNKPVNFAGRYRVYFMTGGYGKECLNESWICGWVIDKVTGQIVSGLPQDDDGSNTYASIGDNGTPVGLPFEIDAYKDSAMMLITGQAIPLKNDENDSPVCKSVAFSFENNKFKKLVESKEGCNIDE